MASRALSTLLVLALLVGLPSCATLQSFMALGQVDFSLDRVHSVRLAGVELDRIRSHRDLTGGDLLRLGLALSEDRLPLELTVDLRADNPEDNPEARLVGLDWTLFLDGRETVAGELAEEVTMPSGRATSVPVGARLDLLAFFDGGIEELVDLAASLAGVSGESVPVSMELIPTIETPIGPIRYPRPLVVGGG